MSGPELAPSPDRRTKDDVSIKSTTTSSSLIVCTSGILSEERRAQLREIEVKVMKYQDDLEAGRKATTNDINHSESVAKIQYYILTIFR
ncbi:unnamed protein product [Protopolystoma xenopodis]|uniref:CWF21 domain-containing protein n=1 Tax=Protopolystoma xenopodis TaxID=117903 RepID=A0A448WX36_9PLAT|nr:unnamed protein product [Protopolystoma xenopodis]